MSTPCLPTQPSYLARVLPPATRPAVRVAWLCLALSACVDEVVVEDKYSGVVGAVALPDGGVAHASPKASSASSGSTTESSAVVASTGIAAPTASSTSGPSKTTPSAATSTNAGATPATATSTVPASGAAGVAASAEQFQSVLQFGIGDIQIGETGGGQEVERRAVAVDRDPFHPPGLVQGVDAGPTLTGQGGKPNIMACCGTAAAICQSSLCR
ncbi:MAG: hypothetical protein RL385_2364 [Pseudomonadota bacterium]